MLYTRLMTMPNTTGQSHLEIGFRYGHCFKYIIVHLRAPPFPVTGSMPKVYHIDRKKVTGK